MTRDENWQQDTARWTSPIYRIRFATIDYLHPVSAETDDAFDLSAWGISNGLQSLLRDFKKHDVMQAIRWVATSQNHQVADMLHNIAEDARRTGTDIPPLQDLFIATETELYLPNGLRMSVCCVTNIVPHGEPAMGMDKFVAILDPGEAQSYISERRHLQAYNEHPRVH